MTDKPVVQATVKASKDSGNRLGVSIQTLIYMASWISALFSGAGRLDWMRGWLITVIYVLAGTASIVLVHRLNPGLLEERAKWKRKDTKHFDKIEGVKRFV